MLSRLVFGFQLRESLAQSAFLLPSAGFVTDNCNDYLNLIIRPVEQCDREGDREAAAILVYGRNAKHVRAVTSLAGLHDFSVAFPMPASQTFRNNQIERFPKRFWFRIAEDS